MDEYVSVEFFEERTVAERIRDLRKYLGYTQSDVAKKLNVSRTSIVQLENDNRKISTEELMLLSELFDVSTTFILYGAGKFDLDKELVQELSKFPPEDQEEVKKFAAFLKWRNRRE